MHRKNSGWTALSTTLAIGTAAAVGAFSTYWAMRRKDGSSGGGACGCTDSPESTSSSHEGGWSSSGGSQASSHDWDVSGTGDPSDGGQPDSGTDHVDGF